MKYSEFIDNYLPFYKYISLMREIYKTTVFLFLKKNFLHNFNPDIFIIRGGIMQGKLQALYDV